MLCRVLLLTLFQGVLLPLVRTIEHRDLFISCDKDVDKRVSLRELEACMGSIRGSTSGVDERGLRNILNAGTSLLQRDKHAALNIMKMFDMDRDEVITLREYNQVLSRSKAGPGLARQGKANTRHRAVNRCTFSGIGMARQGVARQGPARQGPARHGRARQQRAHRAETDADFQGAARHGAARRGRAWPGAAWLGTARQGNYETRGR